MLAFKQRARLEARALWISGAFYHMEYIVLDDIQRVSTISGILRVVQQ